VQVDAGQAGWLDVGSKRPVSAEGVTFRRVFRPASRTVANGGFAVVGRHFYVVKGTRKVTVRMSDRAGTGLDTRVHSWTIVD
jgi:hypothetical protein